MLTGTSDQSWVWWNVGKNFAARLHAVRRAVAISVSGSCRRRGWNVDLLSCSVPASMLNLIMLYLKVGCK